MNTGLKEKEIQDIEVVLEHEPSTDTQDRLLKIYEFLLDDVMDGENTS